MFSYREACGKQIVLGRERAEQLAKSACDEKDAAKENQKHQKDAADKHIGLVSLGRGVCAPSLVHDFGGLDHDVGTALGQQTVS